MNSKQQIDDFLQMRRLAVVGVSRDPKDFTQTVWNELRQRRYEAVPVNPAATELDGQRCYARVQDIEPPVEGVMIMTPPRQTEQVVRDCAEAGVRHVWMHGGMGRGAVSKEALAFCEANGIEAIAGFCPFMFLPGTGAMHAPHRFWKKLTGSYPS